MTRKKLMNIYFHNDVQILLLVIQITIFTLSLIYYPENKEGVAYQRY